MREVGQKGQGGQVYGGGSERSSGSGGSGRSSRSGRSRTVSSCHHCSYILSWHCIPPLHVHRWVYTKLQGVFMY